MKTLRQLRNKIRGLPPQCNRPLFNKYAKLCPLTNMVAECIIDTSTGIVWICSFWKEK